MSTIADFGLDQDGQLVWQSDDHSITAKVVPAASEIGLNHYCVTAGRSTVRGAKPTLDDATSEARFWVQRFADGLNITPCLRSNIPVPANEP